MKKIILSLIIILNLTSCKYLSQLNSDSEITEIIVTKIKEDPEKIDLTKIENLDYDKLLILEPYSNIANIEKELIIDLTNISEHHIHSSDDINLLVFLKNGKSVKISELNRTNGDFENYKVLINLENAKFKKNKKGIINLIK
jgi:hypothetical protein